MERSAKLSVVTTEVNDPARPNLVWAPNCDRTGRIRLLADPGVLRRLEDTKVNSKIGEYCGLIHGATAGGNLQGLMATTHLYQGVKRPCLDVGVDGELFVYVMRPEWTYTFPRNAKATGEGPTRMPPPVESVFVTYVDVTPGRMVLASGEEIEVDGHVRFWEWVFWDRDNQKTPEDAQSRYTRSLWN